MNLRLQIRNLSDADLLRHLQLEGKRGQNRNWCYSLPRHQALIAEVERREKARKELA